ncbi:type VI secretion system membrane subunit TssM [Acidisphaera sp. S103]|uniref:type VI secretion system membrane subunit TssM n=1 Tax=Acidisphaera sp. S103 TaxID=1747223 RepID=UPI00131E8688|nr:type VI secretion system membrane subunit TssM [Acidisphaera sp. S103]
MRAILRFLGSRWFLTFLGVVLLSLLVWWFGPFLSLLESWIARALVIAVMVLLWAGTNLLLDRRRKRTETALVEGVAGPAPDPSATASAEEAAAMRQKLLGALTLLKKASGSRGYLYEQPWYAIIGPPGTGKTTALLNAGLSFPLAAEMGQKVAGFGGTRMCDWWFTDNAVMIDTAGRYTTQEDSAVDRAGWDAFLSLLKRTRARQPLNGLIVVFALQDAAQPDRSIGGSSAPERSVHAATIRRRIKDVYEQLGVRVPVYALFTKVDLVDGFTDFFGDLDREKMGQVWGVTFPLEASKSSAAATFSGEFDLLMQRLNGRVLDRLNAERGADRRPPIAGFPVQMASLQGPLTEFINEAFGASRLDAAPLLRGVYFTSGTQEGTPVDRLTATMARSFGIDQMRAPSLVPEKGRSYFLSRLLKDVIFGESMLVSRDPGAIRRKVLLRAGAAALAVIVAIVGTGALLQTRSANLEAVSRANTALAAYNAAAQALPLDPVRDSDLPSILPLLDQARALPYGAGDYVPGAQWFPGLSQTGKLEAASQVVYRHALENILLPRLIVRLESQMRQNFNQPTFLYEATRVYLELGSLGPLDRNLIKQWMHFDWQANFRGPAADETRTRLEMHLAALLDDRLPKVPLDGALIEDAQRTFSRISLADRVYSAIRRSPQAAALPPWRPGDAAGESGVRVFHRRSGKPMTDGIPGFFTVNGFYKVLLPQLPIATRQAASESWVLGRQTEVDPNSPQALSLGTDVIKLYTDDYIRTWDDLLADIDVEPLGSIQQAVQSLYILSSPQSPMRDLLTGIVHQLMLTVAPPADPAKAAAGGVAGAVANAANAATSQLTNVFATNGPAADPPGKVVETHFAPLIAYVGKGPGAPIDAVLKLMNDLQQQLAQLANSAQGAPPPAGGTDPAQLLLAEASRAPEPVQRWVQVVTGAGNTLRSGGAKKGAGEAFNAPGGPASLCKQAVAGRYPFSPSSPNDIPLDDFGRLFAPNGLLDQFFTTQLRPFVDTSGSTWHAQAVAGVAAPVSPGDLAQFQRAAAIRDLFFGAGGNQPTVRFDIQPISVDNGAKQVTLDFDGTTVVYAHGPLRSVSVTWPGPNRMNSARLVFDPPPSSGPPVLQADGPWALFRLFNQGILQQAGSADRYTLTFNLGDRHAVFEIRAGSVLNPFAPGVLRDFRCPKL